MPQLRPQSQENVSSPRSTHTPPPSHHPCRRPWRISSAARSTKMTSCTFRASVTFVRTERAECQAPVIERESKSAVSRSRKSKSKSGGACSLSFPVRPKLSPPADIPRNVVTRRAANPGRNQISFGLILRRTLCSKVRGEPKNLNSECVIGSPFRILSSSKCRVQIRSAT